MGVEYASAFVVRCEVPSQRSELHTGKGTLNGPTAGQRSKGFKQGRLARILKLFVWKGE
jgi:hypothetical protein